MNNNFSKASGSIKESKITCILEHNILYRGYSLKELADKASYEEVLHLLLYNNLPTEKELENLIQKISSYRKISQEMLDIVEAIPFYQTERLLISILNSEEILRTNDIPIIDGSLILIGKLAPILVYWYHYHTSGKKLRINTYTGSNDRIFSNLLSLLFQSKDICPMKLKAIEKTAILCMDAGIGPPSTFMSRSATVAGSPFIYSLISGMCGGFGRRHLNATSEIVKFIDKVKYSDIEKEVKFP